MAVAVGVCVAVGVAVAVAVGVGEAVGVGVGVPPPVGAHRTIVNVFFALSTVGIEVNIRGIRDVTASVIGNDGDVIPILLWFG